MAFIPPYFSFAASWLLRNNQYSQFSQNQFRPLKSDKHQNFHCWTSPSIPSLRIAAISTTSLSPCVSNMYSGRRKTGSSTCHHSIEAERALQHIIESADNDKAVEDILISFELKFIGFNDYVYLIHELGNRGEFSKAVSCFKYSAGMDMKRYEQEKLTTAIISSVDESGKVALARSLFEESQKERYENTIFAHSASVHVYGRNAHFADVIRVFEEMKNSGFQPDLVTYNTMIDVGAKGGMNYEEVMEIFDEMKTNGVTPDLITYNSLLAVCCRARMWKMAQNLLTEMAERKIKPNVFTYNALLDELCKTG